MQTPEGISSDLALLSQAVDNPLADLAAMIATFSASARLSVPSFLGVSLRIFGPSAATAHGRGPLTLTVWSPGEDPPSQDRPFAPRSSLLLPLDDLTSTQRSDPGRRIELVLYAEHRGAFVDLAADVCWLAGSDLTRAILDRHLFPASEPRGTDADLPTVAAESVVNQALGVLISRGRTPEQAIRDLDDAASGQASDRVSVARQLLAVLDGREEPDR